MAAAFLNNAYWNLKTWEIQNENLSDMTADCRNWFKDQQFLVRYFLNLDFLSEILLHLKQQNYLISSKNTEWIDNLFCCVYICWFSSHEVQEAIKLDVSAVVRIDNGEDALEIDFTLKKKIKQID